jgi:DNA-binding NarL/FixJ family response regulator
MAGSREPDEMTDLPGAADEIRVLLVDDDALVRAGLSMMLNGAANLVIVRAIAEGQTNAEVAASLLMSVPTVKAHVTHILTKAGLANRTQIALLAHDAGLA